MKSIKKQHLVEIRAMGNPPPAVKLALESICLLLGEQTTDWKAIRGIIIKDNFINTIINFGTDDITYVLDTMCTSNLSWSPVRPVYHFSPFVIFLSFTCLFSFFCFSSKELLV